jgi:O-antigen ligase
MNTSPYTRRMIAAIGTMVVVVTLLSFLGSVSSAARQRQSILVMIQTVPEIPGAKFSLNGTEFKTDRHGFAVTTVPERGVYRLRVITDAAAKDDSRLRFSRWSDGETQESRSIRVKSFTLLHAGYEATKPFSFTFVDDTGTAVDPDSIVIIDQRGSSIRLQGSGPHRLPATTVRRDQAGVVLEHIEYEVDEVIVDGRDVLRKNVPISPVDSESTIELTYASPPGGDQPTEEDGAGSSSEGSELSLPSQWLVGALLGAALVLGLIVSKRSQIDATAQGATRRVLAWSPRRSLVRINRFPRTVTGIRRINPAPAIAGGLTDTFVSDSRMNYRQDLQVNHSTNADASDVRALDILDVVLLIGAFIAPMNLLVFRSFSAYDFSVAILAFLIVAGPYRLRSLPEMFSYPAYVFLLVAMISAFRATEPVEALTQLLQFAFIFFVQIPVVLTVVRSRFVLRAALIAFFAGTMVAILTAYLLEPLSGAGRLQTVFNDNANRLGEPTAYLLPFLLFLVVDWWRRRKKLAATVAGSIILYLMIWALAASGSRGGAVGALASLLVFVVFRGVTERPRRILRRTAVAIAMVGALGFLILRTDYFPSTLSERIARTFTPGDDLAEDRTGLNVAGLQAFRESPLVGTGLDNFQYVAWRYDAPSNQAPHNIWIQFLAQVGLVGTAMILLIVGGWFLLVFRSHCASKDRETRDLLWAFLAYGASLMTIFMAAPLIVHRHYWLIFALGIALALELPNERTHVTRSITREGAVDSSVNAGARRTEARDKAGSKSLVEDLPP